MRERAACGDGVAHRFGRLAGGVAARVVGLRRWTDARTPVGNPGDSVLLAESGPEAGRPRSVVGCRSRAGAKIGRRARLIREKIIGHDLRGFAPGISRRTAVAVCRGGYGRLALVARSRAFALLHQPTRQHGRGVLFEPGIEELRDLLAEIGSMAQPRKFVTLQGITGRRQKKLPGRLGFVIQGDLQGKKPVEITSIVNTVKSTQLRTYCGKVCKSLACGQGRKGCASSGVAAQ
jgi:hypothetical protein